jgi:hypothetical protein
VNLFVSIEDIGYLLFGGNGYIYFTIRYDQRCFGLFEGLYHDKIETTQAESLIFGAGHQNILLVMP